MRGPSLSGVCASDVGSTESGGAATDALAGGATLDSVEATRRSAPGGACEHDNVMANTGAKRAPKQQTQPHDSRDNEALSGELGKAGANAAVRRCGLRFIVRAG